MTRPALPLFLFACLIAAPARADLLTGQVVDHNGVGVAGVNIDAFDVLADDDAVLSNDVSGVGGFFTVTIPSGLFDLTFVPPAPPTTTHLATTVDGVAVFGTQNIGTVVLPQGVSLSGRVLGSGGLPIAGVDIDVIDQSTGQQVPLGTDDTDATGRFAVAAPLGPVELELDATKAPGPVHASVGMDLTLIADLDIGDVQLAPGFTVSGIVRGPGGVPVADADLDAIDSTTGEKLVTPGDNSDDNGLFSFVVPAGTFDIDVCPAFDDKLASSVLPGVVVSGNTNLGAIGVAAGAVLSGVIQDTMGAPIEDADVDLIDPITGAKIPTCNDNSQANGTYAVVVPFGTFDVEFEPSGFDLPLGADLQAGVSITGDTTLNGVLPPCPFSSSYGTGTAGLSAAGIVPAIGSSGGAPRVGNDAWSFELSQGLGGNLAVLGVNFTPAALPIFGGTVLIAIDPLLTTSTHFLSGPAGQPGAGSATVPFPVPITDVFVGHTLYAQYFSVDLAPPFGLSMSQGLSATFCL